MRNSATVLNIKDNVAVALRELNEGECADFILNDKEICITIREKIPIYHKFAIKCISKDSTIFKYGQSIGKAICDIEEGSHVHLHDLISIREFIV